MWLRENKEINKLIFQSNKKIEKSPQESEKKEGRMSNDEGGEIEERKKSKKNIERKQVLWKEFKKIKKEMKKSIRMTVKKKKDLDEWKKRKILVAKKEE